MPTPNPNFVASVPLQYVFRDKDTAAPLSAGVVRFYSDPDFTVPKDIYQISNIVNNQVTFVNLGAVLTLSSIGTFVDMSGQNLVPYYWPWNSDPGSAGIDDPGDPQPYFITVYSSGGVFQFSLTYWPPDCLSGSAGSNSQLALTQNQITNPQFSQISFTPIPTGLTGAGTYVYSVSGTNSSYPLAPGWTLLTSGTGNVTVSQLSLNLDIETEPPYAIQIQSQSTVTSLKLVQQINNNPRLLSNPEDAGVSTAFINGGFAASSATAVPLTMYYSQSNGSTTQLANFTTTADSSWAYHNATNAVTVPNSLDNASGYIQVYITIPTNTTVSISSVQLVEVANTTIRPGYIQQSIPEQISNLYWYDQPNLFYKPIPSYTIGWDFSFNPCQQSGKSIAAQALAANTSRYIADQTIAFEAVSNVLSYVVNNGSGLTITATGSPSQFCLIQYLDATTGYELLRGRMSVAIETAYGYAQDVYCYINLYYTTGTPLPSMTTSGNVTSGQSLVATMANGQPATFNQAGGVDWTPVPRSGLGTPSFNLNNTDFVTHKFSGWQDTTVTPATLVTYFAIVVSFSALPAATALSVRYCSLCKGDIATSPAPLNEAQTLQALQYYYEKSYNYNINPGTASAGGYCSAYQTAYLTGGNTNTTLGCSTFALNYRAQKRIAPLVNFYAEDGTINKVTGHVVNGGVQSGANSNIDASTVGGSPAWGNSIGQYQCLMTANSAGPFTTNTGNTSQPYSAFVNYHYVVDARFGVV